MPHALRRGTGRTRAHGGRSRKKDRGLESNHVHVFVHRDVVTRLKRHVALLALADFFRGDVEHAKDVRQGVRGRAFQGRQGQGVHHISRQNRGVLGPLGVHGGTATAKRCLVHDVVVHQGEIVEQFHGHGRGHGRIERTSLGLARRESQARVECACHPATRGSEWGRTTRLQPRLDRH